jgi:hypothetical protein
MVDRNLNLGPGASTVRNEGTLEKRADGTARIRAKIVSTGLIDVQKGELILSGPGTYSSGINVQADATLTLTDDDLPATHDFQVGSQITGPGQVVFSGSEDAVLSIANNHALRMLRFRFAGDGTIRGANQAGSTIGAVEFDWDSGSFLDIQVLVQAGDRMRVGQAGDGTLDKAALMNLGQINWLGGGNIALIDTAYIRNDGSGGEGLFIIQNGQTMSSIVVNGRPTFEAVLGGEIRKTDGAVTTLVLLVRNTNGKIDLQGRVLSISDDYEVSGGQTILGGGSLTIDGDLNQQGNLSEILLGGGSLNAGGINLGDGKLTLGSGTVDLGMGTLTNSGIISGNGSVIGTVVNSGIVMMGGDGAAGTINITGSFTQTAAGSLYAEIGGRGAADSDRLNVSGDVNLAGAVDVWLIGGFVPAAGDVFAILTFGGQRAGGFGQVNAHGDAMAYPWVFEYSTDSAGVRIL